MGKVQIDRADIERRLKAAMVAGGETEEQAERFLPLIIEDMESGELSEADFAAGLQRLWREGVSRTIPPEMEEAIREAQEREGGSVPE